MNSFAREQARWDNMQQDEDSGHEEAARVWTENTGENATGKWRRRYEQAKTLQP